MGRGRCFCGEWEMEKKNELPRNFSLIGSKHLIGFEGKKGSNIEKASIRNSVIEILLL